MLLCNTDKIKSMVEGDTIYLHDLGFNFKASFNMKTGFYFRSGLLDNESVDPFQSSFPHLLDIGVMGHCIAKNACKNGGIDCYQSGFTKEEPHMTIEMFENIIKQCRGKVFEAAIGGRGDFNLNTNFKKMSEICRNNFITPNYTTSGIGLTSNAIEITKNLIGAVAVSWQRQPHTIKAINNFIKAQCITNIHYVLSNKTIDELIDLVKNNKFPKGLNALIILNYKNIGQGDKCNVLTGKESKLKELFELFDTPLPYQIGFDSCGAQYIAKFMKNVIPQSVQSCDSSKYSAYISPSGIMSPCSFDQSQTYGVDLNKFTVEDAWNSLQFELFRDKQKYGLESGKCKSCSHHNDTCSPCVLVPDINSCEHV